MTDISIKMTLQQAEVVSGLLKVLETQEKVTTSIDGTVKASKRADNELKRFADTVNRMETSPFEKYREQADHLRQALDKGLISQEKYNAALKRAQDAYRPHDAMAQMAEKTRQADAARQAEAAKAADAMRAAGEAAAKAKDDKLTKLGSVISERSLSDLDRYKRSVAELREVFAAGKIGPEVFRKELERLTGEYGKATVSGQKHAEKLKQTAAAAKEAADAEKRAADELKKFGDRIKDVQTSPIVKLEAHVEKLNKAFAAGHIGASELVKDAERMKRELGLAGDEAGKMAEQTKESFGSSAVDSLANYAAGVFTIQAAIGQVSKAFQLMREDRDNALKSAQSVEDSDKQLVGLSGGRTSKFQSLRKERDDLAFEYGMSREEAGRALFTAESAGLSKSDRKAMYEFSAVGSSDTAARLMTKSIESFGDQVTGEQALNIAYKAAAETQADPEDLAKNLPKALVSAKGAGLSFEDTVSMVAKFGDVYGSQETATDRATRLISAMASDESLKGKGLQGLDELMADPERLKKFTGGSDELLSATDSYRATREAMRRLNTGLQEEKAISGTTGDAVTAGARSRWDDPLQRSLRDNKRAELRAELAGENRYAMDEANVQTRLKGVQAEINEQGKGIGARYGAHVGGAAAQSLGLSADASEGASRGMSAYFGGDGKKVVDSAMGMLFDRLFTSEEERTKRLEKKFDELIGASKPKPAPSAPIINQNPLPTRK